MGKKGPSEFCFQENSNLLKINHKLYILKEILVSNQYVPSTVYGHFDGSNSLFAIKEESFLKTCFCFSCKTYVLWVVPLLQNRDNIHISIFHCRQHGRPKNK